MQVDVWSDIVCPWCAIGKARLDRALADFPDADRVDVRWRSFELDPAAPATADGDYLERLAGKYGVSIAEARGMTDRMTAQAAMDDVHFRFDIARSGNTFDAHRVLHLAADRGRQHQVKDRLLRAALGEGEAIADHAVLRRLAGEAGLEEVEVTSVLASDRYADDVRADEQLAGRLGVRGVPFFVFDGRFGVSGAQPAEVLLDALGQAWASGDAADAADASDAHNAADASDAHKAADDSDAHNAAGHVCEDGHCTV